MEAALSLSGGEVKESDHPENKLFYSLLGKNVLLFGDSNTTRCVFYCVYYKNTFTLNIILEVDGLIC